MGPTKEVVLDLIARVYDHSPVGGNLHVVTDDWNVRDQDLTFCQGLICAGGHDGTTPDQLKAENECLEALMWLTPDLRLSVIKEFWGEVSAVKPRP